MSDGSKPTTPGVAAAALGGLRAVLAALPRAATDGVVLAIVVASAGSTYRKPGALLLLRAGGRVGWLSGGCLEATLELAADEVARTAQARLLSVNTRGDDDLVFGSASGCRGELQVLLLPLNGAAPLIQALRALDGSASALQLGLALDGAGHARLGAASWHWDASMLPAASATNAQWQVSVGAPPRVLLCGAGPETPWLIRLAQSLGWRVDVLEHRGRWHALAEAADRVWSHTPATALAAIATAPDAVIVMSHHFANDASYLTLAANSAIGFVGLLGPPARRDALLAELPAASAAALLPRLHAPVGMRLGGEGPEAIALAIAAALQSHFGSSR